MSRAESQTLAFADLDALRVACITAAGENPESNQVAWIATASKKQLLGEIVFLYARASQSPF